LLAFLTPTDGSLTQFLRLLENRDSTQMPDFPQPARSAERLRAALAQLLISCSHVAIERKWLQKHETLYVEFRIWNVRSVS
jgi:hypothetical protein